MSRHMYPINLVGELVTALDRAGIDYCHWKSNTTLERAAAGKTDLDLLVARDRFGDFARIIDEMGFSMASRSHVKDPPGTAHYFGYDPSADLFVHLHAHTQLVLGHDRSKNYRLPVERAYLASSTREAVLPTPAPEFEYVVLVIRLILKYAVLDEILWAGLRRRRARPSASESMELEDLRERSAEEVVKHVVEEHLPYVGLQLFERAERLFDGPPDVREALSIAREMQQALSPHARNPASMDMGTRVWRRISLSVMRRIGGLRGFRLKTGGALVAVLGGDGAGKSTALTELSRWLGEDFDVMRVHLGKPPWSWTTYAVRASLKVITALGLLKKVEIEGESDESMEFRRLVWLACQGRDRYLEYRRVRRAAGRGTIVLSDRFPHPALQATDVPKIKQLSGSNSGRVLDWMSRLEDHYHSRVALPDITFVLMLEPSEAARRKTDEPHDYVMERSTEVWEIDWSAHDVHIVDASRSPQEVAGEMKRVLWESLS